MASGLVLVIEDDEWVSRLLSTAIREAGYDLLCATTAKEGFELACSEEPSCIICDAELSDGDGFMVARSVRAQDIRVSVTPFIFLSAEAEAEEHMGGYGNEADVYLPKPFRIQEVVARIDGIIQTTERLRSQREAAEEEAQADAAAADIAIDIDVVLAETPPPPNETSSGSDREPAKEELPAHVSAIEGDLSQMSIATILTVLEMERRTGLFEVVSKKRRAQLEIAGGAVIQGTVGGTRVSALTTLRTMLGWKVGRFSFTPMSGRDAPTNRKGIGALLLEAVRLEDEAMRDELELPPSRRLPGQKLAAPALGGRASADDLAPISSKGIGFIPTSSTPSSDPSSPRPRATPPRTPTPPPPRMPTPPPPARAVPPPQVRVPPPPPPRIPPPPPPQAAATDDQDIAPMSLPPSTIEIDLDPLSAKPTGKGPVFPGLANITGTHRVAKPGQKPASTPPKVPLPPAKIAASLTAKKVSVPQPPVRAGSFRPPPPPPKRQAPVVNVVSAPPLKPGAQTQTPSAPPLPVVRSPASAASPTSSSKKR